MEKRDIILNSMENMLLIYKDVGEIAKAIEQRLSSLGYKAYGDAAITWETSTAWYGYESWLYRWFARVYYKESDLKRAIGYCIHLGGYLPEYVEGISQYGLRLPVLVMSSLDLEKDIKEIYRPNLYNLLWDAGWEEEQEGEGQFVKANVTRGDVSAKAISLAVDLLELKGNEDIENVVIKTLVALYEKKLMDTFHPKLLQFKQGEGV